MIVNKDKVVSLTYELRVDDASGEVIESLTPDEPLIFLFGSGNLLPKFEENINGLKVGEKFSFNLQAHDAYGTIDENAVVNVPVSAFEIDGKVDSNMLRIGNKIPMQDSHGNRLTGRVIEVTDDNVIMDFNHPLAGNHLFFQGEITDVREATEDEISHGHLHASGGGGCCGGGSCGSCGTEADEHEHAHAHHEHSGHCGC